MQRSKWQRALIILSLILAGEAIFTLPYHVTRFFRPTFLEVFDLTATELGVAQSAYGFIAMAAYFFGGPLADRFEPRKLLAGSLWATALGGLYLATFPDVTGVTLIWGFFGLTNILLFWAALIKVTRAWGGERQQGLAYGLLDGGRGLLAAVLASAGCLCLFSGLSIWAMTPRRSNKKGLCCEQVIYGYTAVTAAVGVLVWFTLRGLDGEPGRASASSRDFVRSDQSGDQATCGVACRQRCWLCATPAYKAFDQYALFAVRGHGIDEIDAAQIVATGAWTRPSRRWHSAFWGIASVSRGWRWCVLCLLIISHSLFAFTGNALGTLSMIMLNTLVTGIAIFGLRGLYFGLLEEGQIPLAITGTAVGLVSVIGYTPDVFIAAVAGYLIDQSPGLMGFQHLFTLLLGFSVIGAVAAILFDRHVAANAAAAGR
jgi:sugar phosphate permease